MMENDRDEFQRGGLSHANKKRPLLAFFEKNHFLKQRVRIGRRTHNTIQTLANEQFLEIVKTFFLPPISWSKGRPRVSHYREIKKIKARRTEAVEIL